jgi:nucleolar protein 16
MLLKVFLLDIGLTEELMEIAAQPSIPTVRHPTKLEVHWLQQLVDTYGEDYEGMMKDKELNPMQHTPAQLKRKIKKWKETA